MVVWNQSIAINMTAKLFCFQWCEFQYYTEPTFIGGETAYVPRISVSSGITNSGNIQQRKTGSMQCHTKGQPCCTQCLLNHLASVLAESYHQLTFLENISLMVKAQFSKDQRRKRCTRRTKQRPDIPSFPDFVLGRPTTD